MLRIFSFLKELAADETGASAAEYALILAIVTTGIAAAAITLGDTIGSAMSNAANCIQDTDTC